MTDPRFLDPANYKVGAADIGQFQWLHERLTIHGHPLTKYDDTFKRRDTLTDALKAAFDQWDEYGAQHGYSAVDDTFWVDGYSFADLEAILAARVRAAQAQALRDAADWFETPIVADNYPGFAEVLRANAAQLDD